MHKLAVMNEDLLVVIVVGYIHKLIVVNEDLLVVAVVVEDMHIERMVWSKKQEMGCNRLN